MNELSKLINDSENLHLVKRGIADFHDLCDTYGKCFNEHLAEIVSEDDEDKETKRFEEKQISIMALTRRLLDGSIKWKISYHRP